MAGTDHAVPRLGSWARRRAGDVAQALASRSPGLKCFQGELAEMHRRGDRDLRAHEAAIACRAALFAAFRRRFEIQRTVELKLFCQENFQMVNGNYLWCAGPSFGAWRGGKQDCRGWRHLCPSATAYQLLFFDMLLWFLGGGGGGAGLGIVGGPGV